MSYTILIRHGESEANVAADNSDVPTTKLTKRGHEQAKQAAEYLADLKFLNIKYILASPYTRAMETAEHIAKKLRLKILLVDDLRERSSGIIDGVKFTNIKHMTRMISKKTRSGKTIEKIEHIGEKIQTMDNHITQLAISKTSTADPRWKEAMDKLITLCEAETDADVYHRVNKAIKKNTAGKGSVLIVSHGGAIGAYLGGRFGISPDALGANYGKDISGRDIKNCHLSIINNKTKKLELMINTKYLEY